MPSTDSSENWSNLVAAAADVCLKPWLHAVVLVNGSDDAERKASSLDGLSQGGAVDLIVRIESRSREGDRYSDQDLDLEIYSSGSDLNLMLSWCDQPERPMLWQGKHPVWMDGSSGQRCPAPEDGAPLEALARRLRALLSPTRSDQI